MSLEFDQLRKACPQDWDVLSFPEAVQDVTAGNPKVKQGEYEKQGALAIVDQGQDLIGGYTNDELLACKEKLPCIVFGDHTKKFKFIEQPFALGADGVKILAPIGKFDKRFLYHYLKFLKLPNDAGYSRHYKFLKEKYVVKPPLAEQKRIAAILDKADAIRRKRQAAIKLADDFLRVTFLDMFGDPVTNPKGWEISSLEIIGEIQGGLQVTGKRLGNPLEIPYLRVANVYRSRLDLSEIKTMAVTKSEMERVKLAKGDILIVEGHGNPNEIGRSSVWDASVEPCLHQNHLIRVRVNSEISDPVFINAYLNSPGGKQQLFKFGKTTSGLNTISTSNVKNTKVLLPPLITQKRYRFIVERTKEIQNKSKMNFELNKIFFNSLTQGAFRGEL